MKNFDIKEDSHQEYLIHELEYRVGEYLDSIDINIFFHWSIYIKQDEQEDYVESEHGITHFTVMKDIYYLTLVLETTENPSRTLKEELSFSSNRINSLIRENILWDYIKQYMMKPIVNNLSSIREY